MVALYSLLRQAVVTTKVPTIGNIFLVERFLGQHRIDGVSQEQPQQRMPPVDFPQRETL